MTRPELGAQITLSFLAHVSVFFVANQFLNSSEVTRIDISINTTQTTESTIGIIWKITNKLNPPDLIKNAYVSIYSLEEEHLTYTSPPFRNATSGQYTLTNLHAKMKYNVCVIIRTNKDSEVNKCIGAKTGRSSGLSRLKLMPTLSENEGGGQSDLTVFYVFLVITVFIGIAASSYNMYVNALRAKQINEIRYMAFNDSGNDDSSAFDVVIKRCQVEEPLLPPPQ